MELFEEKTEPIAEFEIMIWNGEYQEAFQFAVENHIESDALRLCLEMFDEDDEEIADKRTWEEHNTIKDESYSVGFSTTTFIITELSPPESITLTLGGCTFEYTLKAQNKPEFEFKQDPSCLHENNNLDVLEGTHTFPAIWYDESPVQ